MSLSLDDNQNSLHQCSKQALSRQLHQDDLRATFMKATSSSSNPKIPDPSLFDFGTDSRGLQEESRKLPSVAECATHLELLQAFRHLRIEVQSSRRLDEVFGIKPENRTVFRKRRIYEGYSSRWEREPVKLRDETFDKRREAKWPLFLRLAASRFLSWIAIIEEGSSWPEEPAQSLHLPPIDVLMVWHALLLNPKWFRSFEKRGLNRLSTVPFPWNQIHATIDSESRDWAFQLSESDQAWFQDKCSLHPDLLGFLTEEQKSLVVRNCLENHGRSHDESQGRGLVPEDIPDVSSEQDIINLLERGFLDSCRVAVSKDDTVEKLVDAVKRQSVFVDKMDRQLWIRSPAVEGTLTRASVRYERFLKLFKLYPRTMLVPTLDVDIVWHTHQCSPAQYELATAEIAGRFIDHNDKLGAATLDPAFENTKALYRIRFADEYRNCLCWDCEGLRSAIASEDSKTDIASVAREAHSRVAYYRAVEIARQKGEKLLPIYRRKFSADDD